jgi:hypothetical protein
VLDLLVRLVERSMVVAADRLAETVADEVRHHNHVRYYLAMAEVAGPQLLSPSVVNELDALEVEHSNLRAALEWISTHGEVEQGLRLAGALARFWWVRGYAREGSAWLDQLLTLADAKPVPAALRAKALQGAAVPSNALGNHARATGDPHWLAAIEAGRSLSVELAVAEAILS